ncbi:MAG: flippase-like domain-containing protein, partial [Candidatus Cloacimonetes bacterium]|nr:flippase-like domain-containing protein [Candidatus Cloacimonadota bacterium]
KTSESFYIFMTGLLVNYLIPIRAGEVAKSFILKVRRNIPISSSLPTVFIDKISDLFPIVLIMILIPLTSIKLNSTLYIIIGLLFVIFIFLIAFLFFAVNHHQKALKILNFFLKFIPAKLRDKTTTFFENFVNGMSVMKNRRQDNILVYLLTLCAVFSEAIYIFAVFKSFGAEISFAKILFGYTLMNLTYILPTPPAQLGSNQFMWVLIFSFALGVDKNLTSAAVTFSHLLTSIWIFLIGAISLISLKIKITDLFPKFKK